MRGSMKIRKTVGIDLGTTNSVIALTDPTDSALLTGRDGQGCAILPSVVGHHAEQDRAVTGWAARQLRQTAEPPVSSVKRHIGLDQKFKVGDAELSAVEVSARILQHCREALACTLNDPRYLLDTAVITMPAYFNHNQIEDTRRAGELAGFEVVELLHEPTAAAMYYSWHEGHGDATYLVYDLGGGTFDVSLIRRRLGDYEVLAVSGDPFLGGDDFDRLLATHLQEKHLRHRGGVTYNLSTPPGRANFAALVAAAEKLKIGLSDSRSATITDEPVGVDDAGQTLRVTATVSRDMFQGLIKDKVHRTIDCCHEALARAREKWGMRLTDVDHIILVGGSSRIPVVRETVRTAFCNSNLPEHVRNSEPLLHEPDLCVAYGAALRGATHGTRYVFSVLRDDAAPASLLPDLDLELAGATAPDLELHWTSPVNVSDTRYTLAGVIKGTGAAEVRYGGSVRVHSFAAGTTEEVFLDARGSFAIELELKPDTDNAMELAVCDNLGRELVRIPACVRHRTQQSGKSHGSLGLGVLPTQLITKPLAIEVLNRGRQRIKQILAPVGAALPGTFQSTCRTVDQSGKIVVPVFEENRVIKQMVIGDVDRRLPVGSPVDVEFQIDVKHNIAVSIRVRQANRCETIHLEGPPPPKFPSREEINAVKSNVEEMLEGFTGGYRTRMKARLTQLLSDLYEARFYDDAPKAIQRMAELRDLEQQLEVERNQQLDPPWPRFAQLVHWCRELTGEVARITGKDRNELLEYVRTQERLAERAFQERNQPLYRESCGNLQRYANSLEDTRRAALPMDDRPSEQEEKEEEARREVERFRNYLAAVWKQVRSKDRLELEEKLGRIARQSQGLSQKAKDDPAGAVRDARRWGTEVYKVEQTLKEGRSPDEVKETTGLLEGGS